LWESLPNLRKQASGQTETREMSVRNRPHSDKKKFVGNFFFSFVDKSQLPLLN